MQSLSNAREKINYIDKELINILEEFKVSATLHATPERINFANDNANTAIEKIVNSIQAAINTDELDEDGLQDLRNDLTEKLTDRFHAVADITLIKEGVRNYDAYGQDQHNAVVSNAGIYAELIDFDKFTAETVLTIVSKNFEEIQHQYHKHYAGPLVEHIYNTKESLALNYAK